MMNISQIFEEHGTNIILLDSDLGTTFDIVKIDEETFELREMFTSYIEDCLPEELFKHLEFSSIADEDWVISDETNIELEPFENLYTTIL